MRFAFLVTSFVALQVEVQQAEKYSLAWSFASGQTREVGWKGHIKLSKSHDGRPIPATEFSFQVKGFLEVKDTDANGTMSGVLRLSNQSLQGNLEGKEFDILIEDGKVKKPELESAQQNQPALAAVLAPVNVQLSRRGEFLPDKQHPLFTHFNSLWPMMGPILPAKKSVKVAESWIVALQSPEMKASGDPAISVEYNFLDLVERKDRKCAHISLDSKQKYRQGGIDMSLSMKSEAIFDFEAGECIQDQVSGNLIGTANHRESVFEFKAAFNFEFETFPNKSK